MQDQKKEKIREALATLAYSHTIVVQQMEQMIDLLNHVLESDDVGDSNSEFTSSPKRVEFPTANRATLSIEWSGTSCFLGNTLLFWFFERLAQSPNRYVSHSDLLEEVWGGERKAATIRGIAKRVRDRLSERGMHDLAKAIDGSVTGYYGLILV